MEKAFAYICASAETAPRILKRYCRTVYELGYVPICPALNDAQYLVLSNADELRDLHSIALQKLARCRMLVVCGSVNPITLTQLERAEQAGFLRLRMRPDQKLEPAYWSTQEGREQLEAWISQLEAGSHAVIDSNDPGSNQPTGNQIHQFTNSHTHRQSGTGNLKSCSRRAGASEVASRKPEVSEAVAEADRHRVLQG